MSRLLLEREVRPRVGVSPLLLPDFVEFNARTFGLRPEYRTFGDPEEGQLATVLYTNRWGRLVVPPNVPYTPIEFRTPPEMNARRRQSRWLKLGAVLAREMRRFGLWSYLPLEPHVTDVRPWQWSGFDAHLRYTFVLPFPFREERRDPNVRRLLRKAARAGLTCTRQTDPSLVMPCIAATERRRGFRYEVDERGLARARELLGDEHLRMYTSHLPDGRVVSARLAIFAPGTHAIGWVAGTCEAGLRTGASQLVMEHMLEDLEASGATGLDLAGANLATIAYEKMSWGAELTPYPVLSAFGLRSVAVMSRRWLRSRHAEYRNGA